MLNLNSTRRVPVSLKLGESRYVLRLLRLDWIKGLSLLVDGIRTFSGQQVSIAAAARELALSPIVTDESALCWANPQTPLSPLVA